MTSKLYKTVDELFSHESLFEVVDFERGFVGKYLQSPGHLAALVNDDRSFGAGSDELHVFFVNDSQIVIGQLLFNTDDVEVPQDLDESNFVEGFISESADDLDEWAVITVAYGTYYNSLDLDAWAEEDLGAVQVLDILNIKDDRWSSGMCEGGSCCPPNGTEIQPLSHYEGDSVVTESSESISLDELLTTLNNTLTKLGKE
jgi:hypothetical protein